MEYPVRLDVYLTNKNLVNSRNRAQTLIKSGQIYVNNIKIIKPGYQLETSDIVVQKGEGLKYVSRGGLKLEKAISYFNIDLEEKVCMDIGASTGGFTQCMLKNGAKKVYAVDVGTKQLAEELRNDIRVVNLEQTNIRDFDTSVLKDEIDFFSVDVSFISLKHILPEIRKINKNARIVLLVKPQFETERKILVKKGVVRSKKLHLLILKRIFKLISENEFIVSDITFSPIKGPEGNTEYLFYLGGEEFFNYNKLNDIISQAFNGSDDEDIINT